jgi:hypothetical protein
MASVIAPAPFRLATRLEAIRGAPPRNAEPAPATSTTRRRTEAETVARLADLSAAA